VGPEVKLLAPKVLSYTLKQYKKRHEVAHFGLKDIEGGFYISPFYNRTKFPKFPDVKGLTRLDIEKRAKRFTDLALSISWLSQRVKRDRLLPPGFPRPVPDLIVRLQKGDQTSAAP
jgi:hypothetical protein